MESGARGEREKAEEAEEAVEKREGGQSGAPPPSSLDVASLIATLPCPLFFLFLRPFETRKQVCWQIDPVVPLLWAEFRIGSSSGECAGSCGEDGFFSSFHRWPSKNEKEEEKKRRFLSSSLPSSTSPLATLTDAWMSSRTRW